MEEIIRELGELCDGLLGLTMQSMAGFDVTPGEGKRIGDRIRQLVTENREALLHEFQGEIERVRQSGNRFPLSAFVTDDGSEQQGMRTFIAYKILKTLS